MADSALIAAKYARTIVLVVAFGTLASGDARLVAQERTTGAKATTGVAQGMTAWSGAYTIPQARRGELLFQKHCDYCHGADLRGGDDYVGPSLKGASFLRRWGGKTVGELFSFMSEFMPYDGPHTLTIAEYADLTSFILEANGLPPGDSELPGVRSKLDEMLLGQKP